MGLVVITKLHDLLIYLIFLWFYNDKNSNVPEIFGLLWLGRGKQGIITALNILFKAIIQ